MQHLTGFIKTVVHVDIFERVPGIFALLCAIENQSHQVPMTTDDLAGIHTAHNLHGEKRHYHRHYYYMVLCIMHIPDRIIKKQHSYIF